jgi:hypothetical protein
MRVGVRSHSPMVTSNSGEDKIGRCRPYLIVGVAPTIAPNKARATVLA